MTTKTYLVSIKGLIDADNGQVLFKPHVAYPYHLCVHILRQPRFYGIHFCLVSASSKRQAQEFYNATRDKVYYG